MASSTQTGLKIPRLSSATFLLYSPLPTPPPPQHFPLPLQHLYLQSTRRQSRKTQGLELRTVAGNSKERLFKQMKGQRPNLQRIKTNALLRSFRTHLACGHLHRQDGRMNPDSQAPTPEMCLYMCNVFSTF